MVLARVAVAVVGRLRVTGDVPAALRGTPVLVASNHIGNFDPVVLVAGMPLSIAGWGLREGAMVAVFALVGVPMDGALLMSVLLGLLLLLISLPGGLVLAFSESGFEPGPVDATVRSPPAGFDR